MKILSIDTSTDVCGVGMTTDESGKVELLGQTMFRLKNAHSEKLTGLIEQLFSQANVSQGAIDTIAVTIGPGSFTGLRIGLSVAKGLSFGWDKPLIGIPTLECIAFPFKHIKTWVALTSRKHEFYAGCFDNEKMITEKKIYFLDELKSQIKPGETVITDDPDAFIGNNFTVLDKTAAYPQPMTIGLMAHEAARTGKFADRDSLEPDYWQGFRGKQ